MNLHDRSVPRDKAKDAAAEAIRGTSEDSKVSEDESSLDPDGSFDDPKSLSLLVIAGIRSEVSLHSLTGDGGKWGKNDWGPDEGMTAIAGGEIIVDGLAMGKYEIDIGTGQAMDNLRLKREDPDLLVERMAKMKVPGQ